jgi:glycosyltransferase involved in cell wall biosynthesis
MDGIMIRNEDIVYIANDLFAENKTSAHHIAEIISENNRVLYIEAAGQRPPRASKRDLKKIFNKIANAWKNPQEVRKNIYLYSPLIIPYHKYGIIREINRLILRNTIRRACRKLNISNPILWIFLPHFSSIVDFLSEKGVVYYVVDEYSSQVNVDQEMIRNMEKYILERADIVFTVSEKLLESKKKINMNTYISLHGVDIDHFKKAYGFTNPLPDDIAKIPRPIAGFFGLIEDRVDLDLIQFLADSRPDICFVLIGLVAQDISRFQNYQNVFFLGVKPYNNLPSYLACFDVCLMPYKLNTEMIHSNPKKLREYLAGGKPVVSVRIREVERYRDLLYIADTYEDFLRSIDLSLAEDGRTMAKARLDEMAFESWPSKVEAICSKISQHIKGVTNV